MTLKQWKGVSINKFTREDLVDALDESVAKNEREMRLRDECALIAFKAMLEKSAPWTEAEMKTVAELAWTMADAMVEARHGKAA